MKSLEYIRDCVRQAFLNGSNRGQEFRKMRHAIIYELERVGFDSSEVKDKLLEWDQRCEKPHSISEQKSQLLKYVDWFESKECKMSCRSLEDYCLGKNNCQFYIKTSYKKRQEMPKLPFNIDELETFLRERFKADGYTMLLIIKSLRFFQYEKASEIVFIGYRKICSIIRDKFGHRLSPMDIFRKMQYLKDEGIIEQVFKGKRGNFTKKANGYKLLPWKLPKHTQINENYTTQVPIITHMCNKL